jgi:hypothetical protein
MTTDAIGHIRSDQIKTSHYIASRLHDPKISPPNNQNKTTYDDSNPKTISKNLILSHYWGSWASAILLTFFSHDASAS